MDTPFDVQKWSKFWLQKSEEIKESSLENEQTHKIWSMLFIDLKLMKADPNFYKEYQLVTEVINEVFISLQLAYSNYRQSKPSWARIFGGSTINLPDLNMFKLEQK